MIKDVPFLSENAIERDAATLLAEYVQAQGMTISPPVPIEDIIEKHLKLQIEFDDMHKLLDIPRRGAEPDILGAMIFNEGRIVVDESLDPRRWLARRFFEETGNPWRGSARFPDGQAARRVRKHCNRH